MKQLTYPLAFLCLTVLVPTMHGHDAQQPKVERQKHDPKKVKELMHMKLENAQKILEALALNDMDSTARHADALIKVSKEAEWVVFKTPEYEMNSRDFRSSLEILVRQSKDKNLEGAKLTYLEMTMTCFHCHRYVRDVGMVRTDDTTSSR